MKGNKYLNYNTALKFKLYHQNEHINYVLSNQDNFQTVSGNKFKINGTEYNIHGELLAFTGYVITDEQSDKKNPMKWNRDGKALIDASHLNKNQFDLIIKETVNT